MSYTQCVFENGRCKFCGNRETPDVRFGSRDMCAKPHLNPDSSEFKNRPDDVSFSETKLDENGQSILVGFCDTCGIKFGTDLQMERHLKASPNHRLYLAELVRP